jgi:hypothetical protein
VTIGRCEPPAFATAGQQDRPSLTTLLPGAKSRLASSSASLRKPLTTVSPSRLGRPALGRGLDRGHDRRLARGAAAALAARPLPAEIGVVDLDPAGELRLRGLARAHGPHQLVLHQPGGLPLDPETPAELDRRDAALALGEAVDRREPGGERQLGVLEHRAGGQPHLPLAAVALEQLARLGPAETAMAAGRAGQALAPAHLGQRLPARLLAPEALPELGLAQSPHRAPQPVRRCHPPPPPAPKAAETLARLGMHVLANQVSRWLLEARLPVE